MTKKILCVGEALIDMICTDKGKALAEGENFLKKPGGAPTNVAAAIAALGGSVQLAAKVGNDPFGEQLVEVMKNFGVDTTWMLRDNDHFTTMAFVSLMENGERDFVFSRGADGELSISDVAAIDLSEVSIIHFGSATGFLPGPLQQAYLYLLKKAQELHIFISFDPNYRQLLFKNNTATFIEQSMYFLQLCHFFKVSDEEALLLTNSKKIEDAVAVLQNITTAAFAITIGKEGTLFSLGKTTTIVPSIAITPVDTTGAGDAFVGALLYQLSEKNTKTIIEMTISEWEKIITNANKAGARTCEYMGAMEAFKHLNNQIFN